MTTMFQKRHYIAIAKLLHAHWLLPDRWVQVNAITENFSDLFAGDNPLYDRDKFIDAVHGKKGGK